MSDLSAFMFLLFIFIGLPFTYVIFTFTKFLIQNIREIDTVKVQPKKPKQVNIVERIGCLGYYQGLTVSSHVKLKTGELFEYVSVAIKSASGFYKSATPEIMHIVVDEILLYKLVQDQV